MLDLVLYVAALTASPAPSATPAPAASASAAAGTAPVALKTIVNVRSTTFCEDFAERANAAIGAAMRNDLTIGHTVQALQTGQLDGNSLQRRNAIERLSNLADQLYHDWKNGDEQVRRLRALAASATDPQEKQQLKAFADWLGGALWRQRKIGRDLDGFVAYLNARDMMHIDSSQANVNIALFGTADPSRATAPGDSGASQRYLPPIGINYDPSDTSQAAAAARDFQRRVPSIVSDELEAASTGETAADHC